MFYFFVRSIASVWFKLFFGLKVYGAENVPRAGPVIIAGNHASYLDPPLLAVTTPRALHFVARESLFENRLFGRFIRGLNSIPIKRGFRDINAIRQISEVLKQSRAVLMFPEGTRTQTGEPGRAKAGFAFIAALAQAQVVPAYINGTFQAWPKGAKKINYRSLNVTFGKPVRFEIKDPTKEDYQAFADKVMAEITKLGDAPLQKNRV